MHHLLTAFVSLRQVVEDLSFFWLEEPSVLLAWFLTRAQRENDLNKFKKTLGLMSFNAELTDFQITGSS